MAIKTILTAKSCSKTPFTRVIELFIAAKASAMVPPKYVAYSPVHDKAKRKVLNTASSAFGLKVLASICGATSSITLHSKRVSDCALSAFLYTVYVSRSAEIGSMKTADLSGESTIDLKPNGETLKYAVAEGLSIPIPMYDLISGYLAANAGSIVEFS